MSPISTPTSSPTTWICPPTRARSCCRIIRKSVFSPSPWPRRIRRFALQRRCTIRSAAPSRILPSLRLHVKQKKGTRRKKPYEDFPQRARSSIACLGRSRRCRGASGVAALDMLSLRIPGREEVCQWQRNAPGAQRNHALGVSHRPACHHLAARPDAASGAPSRLGRDDHGAERNTRCDHLRPHHKNRPGVDRLRGFKRRAWLEERGRHSGAILRSCAALRRTLLASAPLRRNCVFGRTKRGSLYGNQRKPILRSLGNELRHVKVGIDRCKSQLCPQTVRREPPARCLGHQRVKHKTAAGAIPSRRLKPCRDRINQVCRQPVLQMLPPRQP